MFTAVVQAATLPYYRYGPRMVGLRRCAGLTQWH